MVIYTLDGGSIREYTWALSVHRNRVYPIKYTYAWWRHQMETFFRVTGPLWGESTDHRWIPLTKASDAELWCFLWYAPEQTVEQTIIRPAIWDATRSLWRHCDETMGCRTLCSPIEYETINTISRDHFTLCPPDHQQEKLVLEGERYFACRWAIDTQKVYVLRRSHVHILWEFMSVINTVQL